MRRRRARVLVLAILLTLTGLEVGLRTLGGYGADRVFLGSERLGHRLLPGQRVHAEGVFESINAQGFRDREWPAADGAGPASAAGDESQELRIAVLGASLTYGVGVEVDATWPRRLEARLSEAFPERRVRVMNAAVPGYGLTAMSQVLEDELLPRRPHWILLSLGPFALRPLEPRRESRRFPLHTLLRRSAIVDFCRRRMESSGRAPGPTFEQRMGTDPFAPEHEPLWRAAHDALDSVLARLESTGTRALLVQTPLLEHVLGPGSPDPAGLGFAGRSLRGELPALLLTHPAFAERLGPLRRELSAGLERESVFSRRPERRSWNGNAPTLFRRDDPVHLDREGHALLARLVAERLEAELRSD